MTDTKYVRDVLKLNSLYGQMVSKAYKSGNTHAKMEDFKNDQSQK